ncbi:L-ribulose-5-phosphate 4-epimerase AraD [Acuticoccus sp. I52.16.1]|uniref:L-ribulose-5-phosphate 4-epimerase AraD n=1 Tax=Acuticoccus sp. I52.16.1 TaxID=2928472 RepID=UPI001FD589E8|nr:L-ribulose-5-phosphate 4-epimerase AraD [Acuticoccus sp. I52.16.1]UOM36229.1 L-ribulose-5-phosphate 4-epimerase AraD [Acuticoccus sp. I52.16.1]
MTLDALKERVRAANVETVARGLVISTFGNASGIDRAAGRIAIKPSGVPYDALTADSIVVTTLDGVAQDNRFKPSSDLATHVVLYRAFEGIGGVVHTHSTYATIFAQAGRPIPCLGTTHADYFRGPVPVTRALTPEETGSRYVEATGEVIVETFAGRDPAEVPAALVQGHGPFVWGATPEAAVENAFLLEEIARMAYLTLTLAPGTGAITDHLRDRHYLRKHGAAATYGQ